MKQRKPDRTSNPRELQKGDSFNCWTRVCAHVMDTVLLARNELPVSPSTEEETFRMDTVQSTKAKLRK